ncbi:MAG TPA: proton-conducting transporter membrane subunit [Armatimonadota bacterium]|nr:proton-conducting transporter membrane subunit [Armatimonadota bacterium]
MTSEQLLFLAFGLLVVGAVITSLFHKDWRKTGYIATAFMGVASISLWILALRAFSQNIADIRPGLKLAVLGASLTFHIDKLSAIFLLVLPFVGLASMVYAIEYMGKVYAGQSPARYYPFALLLMGAIVGVVASSDLFFFIVFWELMTLTSWVLVWFDREDATKVRAAWVYFVMIHVATACMLAAGVVTYSLSGSWAFGDIAGALGRMGQTNPVLIHIVLALFLIGFTTKAGMFPFGGWLPEAHPAAPGPASAIFSGAMIKTGIYGVFRVFVEFLAPEYREVWGGIIAVLGTTSIFVGTLTALLQDDSKRVLSFHSIGQVGYMLLGIGTGIFFLNSSPVIAVVALIAGLFHVVNHACFKSLLFLNAAAAEYSTGTRDLNKVGGLGALMPLTMATAIIASLAIAGIPPLNGFASKWLIYQSSFQGGLTSPLFLLLVLAAFFSSIATLASFMKFLGAIFLGKLATAGKKVTGDVPASMQAPQIALAVACIVLGIIPLLPITLLYGAVRGSLGSMSVPGFANIFGANLSGISLHFGGVTAGVWNPAIATIGLLVCGLIAYAISKSGNAPSRETAPWYGGEEYTTDQVRYRAHGFVLPFKSAFVRIYPTVRLPRMNLQFLRKLFDFDGWLYNPLVKSGSRLTDRISRSHSGLPAMYMLWQLIGVVLVLVILFAWR